MNRAMQDPGVLMEDQGIRLRANADAALQAIEQQFAGRSWLEVAKPYFEAHRAAGQAEMCALLDALGVEPPVRAEDGGRILAIASRVFLGSRPGDAQLTPLQDGQHRLQVGACPIYRRLLNEHPIHQADGMTACSCTYRRRGWYDVLGLAAWDEPEANMKWATPAAACSSTSPDGRQAVMRALPACLASNVAARVRRDSRSSDRLNQEVSRPA